MKQKNVFILISILFLLFTVINLTVVKATATSNVPINNQTTSITNEQNNEIQYDDDILESKDKIVQSIQSLSESKPRNPKSAMIMIIITITVAIIIILISWWYSTNF